MWQHDSIASLKTTVRLPFFSLYLAITFCFFPAILWSNIKNENQDSKAKGRTFAEGKAFLLALSSHCWEPISATRSKSWTYIHDCGVEGSSRGWKALGQICWPPRSAHSCCAAVGTWPFSSWAAGAGRLWEWERGLHGGGKCTLFTQPQSSWNVSNQLLDNYISNNHKPEQLTLPLKMGGEQQHQTISHLSWHISHTFSRS